jgi:hypothetical protein
MALTLVPAVAKALEPMAAARSAMWIQGDRCSTPSWPDSRGPAHAH